MRSSRLRRGIVAATMASALALAGCGSSDGGETPTTGGSDGDTTETTDATDDGEAAGGEEGGSDAIISVNGTEPQKPLIPAATSEVGGGKVVDALFEGLIYYDAEGLSHMGVATSIEALNDEKTEWEIKLRDDAVFSDGTPVLAHNFVDAWNYAANIDNALDGQYFFYPIEGWSEEEPVTEMSGLAVVDDYTFTVKATPDFPDRLGYSAFYPLPDVAFEDMDAYGQDPIGNGSYKMDGPGAWKHDVEINLVKNDTYVGDRVAQNGGLHVVIYAGLDAAYTDVLAGNLDILDQIPEASLALFEDEFPGRSVNQTGMLITTLTISTNLEHFGMDDEGIKRRQALSMAIDRDEITDVIFKGTNLPSKDFTSSAVAGYTDSLAGNEVLEFNPEKAKELWAEADAISPYSGTLEIATNTDGPHLIWVEALANQLANTLEISTAPKSYPTFAAFLEDREADVVGGAFRAGWQADYPGMYNFLAPLYATNASSNHGFYSNAEFDQLLDDASRADSQDVAIEKLQAAQEILLQELPSIPLWNQATTGAWAEGVDNVEFGWNSVPLFYEITKN